MPTSIPTSLPTPVARDSRSCFGILWFATEAEAETYGAEVTRQGQTYNGGFFHGMACGRDKSWDREVNGTPQFAVTTR